MRALPLLILAACTRYTAFTPATAPAPDDAFSKATRVLVERGESIETKDEDAGVIVTAWKEESSFGGRLRLRWTVTLASGSLTVNSQCEAKINDPAPGQRNEWTTCTNQPSDRGDLAKQIADAIAR